MTGLFCQASTAHGLYRWAQKHLFNCVNSVPEKMARFNDMCSPAGVHNTWSYGEGKQHPNQIIHNPLIYFKGRCNFVQVRKNGPEGIVIAIILLLLR